MKKHIEILYHSFVDVITNSSTVIYVQVHDKTVELIKEFINHILKLGDSKYSADDLFEFKITFSEQFMEDRIDEIVEEFSDDAIKDTSWEELNKKAKEIYYDRLLKGEYDGAEDESCYGYDRRRVVMFLKSDTKQCIDIASKIQAMFEIDGCRDG